MESRAHCHAMARDCERAAQGARTAKLRSQLLDQAATWWRLAGEPPGYGYASGPVDGGDRGEVGDRLAPGHDRGRHA